MQRRAANKPANRDARTGLSMNSHVLPASSSATARVVSPTWWWLLAAAVLLRLLTLPLMPLTDHTEARYAEIARLMVQLGDWISPHITPNEVFWAKPPLSTWSQALLMAGLGVNEWTGRLASCAWGLLGLLALNWMLRDSVSGSLRVAALLALWLCPLYFLSAGTVMTDATLGATVALVQACWWRLLCASDAQRRSLGLWMGLFVGLCLLTKGPAAVVLALLPVLLHAAWWRHWGLVLAVLRQPGAWLLCLGVAVPWYALAEVRTPGFLSYFLLGEHVMRFLEPGWRGDRYGFAHAEPLGKIWVFALLAALPCLLAAGFRALQLRLGGGRGAMAAQLDQQLGAELRRYAWCLALAPLLMFSFARNIIWTYALTALPGIVLLSVGLWSQRALSGWKAQAFMAAVLLLSSYAFAWLLPEKALASSDKPLIQAYEARCPSRDCSLRYTSAPPYSAFFYTSGRLYQGMPGVAGRPGFEIRPEDQLAGAAPLACNKDSCLIQLAASPAPSAASAPTP